MNEKTYRGKRSFDQTPEPQPEIEGNVDPGRAAPGTRFVVHQHHARRLHFDLRLEMLNGEVPVLVSWAVPKNVPFKKGERHLAVHVEDHPIDYASFSGTIPAGNYGAGEVRIFDEGEYELLEQEAGKLTIRLKGQRLRGVWHLVHIGQADGNDWLSFLRSWEGPERDNPPPLQPMLATLVDEPFDDDGYLFEFKWDGVRALAVCTDETSLISRTGRDMTSTYPELAELHRRAVAIDCILDGEIVALADGRPSFELLQSRINLQNPREIERTRKKIPVSFVAFDVLYLDGKSLVSLPVEKRKEVLDDLIVTSESISLSPFVAGGGRSLFDIASDRHLEGIVAKKLGSPYRPGKRTREWLKIKAVHEADLVIGGYTAGEGSRSKTFGALLLGAYDENGDLCFLGAVGTGFSESMLDRLLPELAKREAAHPPFADDPKALTSGRFGKPIKNPKWLKPELVGRVEYRELTHAPRLRAPSFKGLRDDIAPGDCLIAELPGRN